MKKTLLDDIVSHIAESVVQRFVKSRKGKEASQEEPRGKEPVSIEVLKLFEILIFQFWFLEISSGVGRLPP